tara:strand:- start:609 stop:1085 length:477 start_codon:yes stop_codon:yes gene_type:complete
MSFNSPTFTKYDHKEFKNFKVGIIKSCWNNQITDLLYNSSYNHLIESGIKVKNIISQDVPGSIELVYMSNYLIPKYNLDGVIALGCIIKGETDHDVYISHAVANGLIKVSIKNNKPVIFGVLTTNNLNQALERCGGKHGDKGLESAQSLLQVISNCKD